MPKEQILKYENIYSPMGLQALEPGDLLSGSCKNRGSTQVSGLPWGSDGKASGCHGGDLCLIPGSGRNPVVGNGNPLQYSCLENSMDGGA